jgi:tetratricopeptide (TPR) repeat protein
MEYMDEALESVNCAIRLSPKSSSYQMRASIYVKLKYYQKAYNDLQLVLSDKKDPESLSHTPFILLAKCENQFGNISQGIEYLKTGLRTIENLKPAHKTELLLELVINYLTISDTKNVEKHLNEIFGIDSSHLLAHGYNGLYYQNTGQAAKSIKAYKKVLEKNPKEIQSHHFIGLGYFAQGNYAEAINWFDKLLTIDPNHYAWCLREMAWYRWNQLDTVIDYYNFDSEIHWLLKDSWIRKKSKSDYCHNSFCHKSLKLVSKPTIDKFLTSGNSVTITMQEFYSEKQSNSILQALQMTNIISSWIQVDSPGFLKHKRSENINKYFQ